MMKTLLVPVLILACGSQLNAQHNVFRLHPENSKTNTIIHHILNRQALRGGVQKPTQIQQRVLAQTTVEINGSTSTIDSFRYTYSGTHHSRYDYNQVGYNQTFEPVYPPMITDYRYASDPLNLVADSIIHYYNGILNYTGRAFYRSDEKMDSIHTRSNNGSGNFATDNSLIHYDANNHVSDIYRLEDNGTGGLNVYSSQSFYYNNTHTRVIADTNIIDPAASVAFWANRYIYNDVSGRLDTSYSSFFYTGGEIKSRNIFSYYPDGRLAKAVRQSFNGLDWATEGYDSLGYTGTLDYYTYWKQTSVFTSGSQTIEISNLTRQFPGANGAPDSVWQYAWDNQNAIWAPLVKWTYTYNNFDNPLKFTSTSFETGSPVPMGYIDFYYEEYNDGLAIVPLENSSTLRVYPNPFYNKINIDWEEKTTAEVTMTLTSLSGRQVFAKRLRLSTGQNEISLPEIAGGNYLLRIQDTDGHSRSSKMVKP